MKEVSCKVLAQMVREAERLNFPPTTLTKGTPYELAHLRNGKERIHWHEFMQIMANARQIWSDEQMVEIGKRIATSPLLLPLALIARLLFTPKDFYFYLNKGPSEGGGGTFFTNMHPYCREVGPNRLEIDLLTQEGYPLCREFYLLTLGAFTVVPTPLGLPEAVVTMEEVPRGVRYKVAYPSGGGALRKVAKVFTWPFAARAVAKQLMEANEVLESRYQEIVQARVVLADQATKLRTAHTVNALIQKNLDLDLTIESIANALVDEAGFACALVALDADVDGVEITRSIGRGGGGGARLERVLEGHGGHATGKLTVFAHPSASIDEREELLDFIVPSIAMAVDNAISYLVVEEYRRGLEHRVAERTAELSQARDALAGTVHDLEQAKEVRDRIFANINHDLRSPLSLVLLSVAEARAAGSLGPTGAQSLDAIEHGARRVLRMVDELLILAEGREREIRLWTALCDLGGIVEAVANAWKPAARGAGLTLDHDIERGLIVRADPNAIERILANLVSNAVKFTPKGGAIVVSISSRDGRAILTVRDNGPGIDPELRKRLFGRFERGAHAKRSAVSGSGLGLSLVKELAEAHGGAVSLSDADGGGAIFRVELPLTSDADQRDAVAAAPHSLRPSDYGAPASRAGLPTVYEPPGAPRATILLAEDDPDLRDRTAKLLATEYRVLTAPDGVAALELATVHAPDLLVTDVAMPGMDGIELTRRFRALEANRVAPVLVLTTFGGASDKLAGFDAGAVDYIHKPFEPTELRARVRSQLALRSLALQLLETEKLAALGTLSAGLAHEIRNPANGIINAVAPLRELLPPEAIAPDTPAAQLLDVVEHCSQQVAALSRELLGFKRGVALKCTAVPIDALLRRVKSTIRHALDGVELRERLDYRGSVSCAEPLLAQVLTNLIENGAHAAGKGGWIELSTSVSGDRVVIELSDSGPGVSDELRERIFEPFFTTKPAGSGTGLGLSTARDIVLRHGGALDVRRAAGRTVFHLELPFQP